MVDGPLIADTLRTVAENAPNMPLSPTEIAGGLALLVGGGGFLIKLMLTVGERNEVKRKGDLNYKTQIGKDRRSGQY